MYSFVYEGKTYYIAILNSIDDYMKLDWQEDTIYFIKHLQVFILKGYVIAKGNLRDCYTVDEPYSMWDIIKAKKEKEKINLENEHSAYGFEILEIKDAALKTADTNETVLELSVPSADELDSYFSSIGLSLPEVD